MPWPKGKKRVVSEKTKKKMSESRKGKKFSEKAKKKKCIHHIDYNKQNDIPKNLIWVCRSCHNRTNYNREYWKIIFRRTPWLSPLSTVS